MLGMYGRKDFRATRLLNGSTKTTSCKQFNQPSYLTGYGITRGKIFLTTKYYTMTEEVKLLPEEVRANSFEKILATTGAINWYAHNVQEVLGARRQSAWAIEKGALGESQISSAEFHKKLATDAEEFLLEIQKDLHERLEMLMDFCNNCDAVSETDITYGDAVLDVLNDIDRDVEDDN